METQQEYLDKMAEMVVEMEMKTSLRCAKNI